MNKAFIAICFWQSLPDLPPLGRHVPLTAFYRLVKAELNTAVACALLYFDYLPSVFLGCHLRKTKT